MGSSISQQLFDDFNNTFEGVQTGSSNKDIEVAMKALKEDPSLANKLSLYEAIRVRMCCRAQFVIPTPTQPDGQRAMGMILDDATHTEYYVAFTGIDSMDPLAGKQTISYGIKRFLENTMVSGADGIYINPRAVGDDSGNVRMTGFKLLRDGILNVLKAYYNPVFRTESIKTDITTMDVDAIVNATDVNLSGGGGVDRAVHKAAGPRLAKECRKIGSCKTGEAVITEAYGLCAKKIIHTAGPVYSNNEEDQKLLANCYRNVLELAKDNDLHTIAFPGISTGTFGYPLDEASRIAFDTVVDWLEKNPLVPLRVLFISFDDEAKEKYDSLTDNYKDFMILT